MKEFKWKRFTLVAGNSSHWQETAETIRQLSAENELDLHHTELFPAPYVDTLHQNKMADIVDRTYHNTRSKLWIYDI